MISIPDVRVVHIRNTLSLSKLSVSGAYLPEIEKNSTLKRLADWHPMAFDDGGNLISPFTY